MEQKQLLIKINEVAVRWNKTRDPKDKDLWYKLIKEFNHGIDRTERWNVSVNSVVKADDGTCVFIGRRQLHGSVRDTKTKTNRLR